MIIYIEVVRVVLIARMTFMDIFWSAYLAHYISETYNKNNYKL